MGLEAVHCLEAVITPFMWSLCWRISRKSFHIARALLASSSGCVKRSGGLSAKRVVPLPGLQENLVEGFKWEVQLVRYFST